MAMQSVVLLTADNERLRGANERQKRKRQYRRSHISRDLVLVAADAQALLQPTQLPQVVQHNGGAHVTLSPKSAPRGGRAGLPSCFICYGYNHTADQCNKSVDS